MSEPDDFERGWNAALDAVTRIAYSRARRFTELERERDSLRKALEVIVDGPPYQKPELAWAQSVARAVLRTEEQ